MTRQAPRPPGADAMLKKPKPKAKHAIGTSKRPTRKKKKVERSPGRKQASKTAAAPEQSGKATAELWREIGPGVYTWEPPRAPEQSQVAATPEQPLRQSIVRLDGVPVWAWQETPKERLEAAYFADLHRQLCEEIEKGEYAISLKGGSSGPDYYRQLCEELKKVGVDPGSAQPLPQLFSQLVKMFPTRLLHGPPAVQLSVYLLVQDCLNRHPPKISKPESIGRFVEQLMALVPNMTEPRAIQIAANMLGMRPNTASQNYGRFKKGAKKSP